MSGNKEQQEMFHYYMEISKLLNTGLDAKSLKYCIHLCESGFNPEQLAKTISELKTTIKTIEEKLESKEISLREDNSSL